MSVNYEELLEQEAFSPLSAEQKKAYIELAEKLKGKSMSESMLAVAAFMKKTPKSNRLSDAEQKAMFDAILSGLPQDEAEKFQKLMKLAALGRN